MLKWQQTICLAHFVIHLIIDKLDPSGLNGTYEEAVELLEILEADSQEEQDDQADPDLLGIIEDIENGSIELNEDGEANVIFVDQEGLDALFGEDVLNVEELLETTSAYADETMAFRLVRCLDRLATIFEELSAYPGLSPEMDDAVSQHFDSEDCADLCELWRDFDHLAVSVRREAVFQWLMAATLLSCSHKLDDEARYPSEADISEAIQQALDSRDQPTATLMSNIQDAYDLLMPRVNEISRLTAPDSEQSFEIFDSNGCCLDANTIAIQLPKALESMKKCPCRY